MQPRRIKDLDLPHTEYSHDILWLDAHILGLSGQNYEFKLRFTPPHAYRLLTSKRPPPSTRRPALNGSARQILTRKQTSRKACALQSSLEEVLVPFFRKTCLISPKLEPLTSLEIL